MSATAALRVGLIAPPWVAVPPPKYGGTELVIDNLARGLLRAGHEVVLFTTGESTCEVERHWSLARSAGTTADFHTGLGHVQAAYSQLRGDTDIIHDRLTAERWRDQALALKRRFNEDYWVEELGWYAMALDEGKEPVHALASNVGHCLWTGIIDERRASTVAKTLASSDMSSGYGL